MIGAANSNADSVVDDRNAVGDAEMPAAERYSGRSFFIGPVWACFATVDRACDDGAHAYPVRAGPTDLDSTFIAPVANKATGAPSALACCSGGAITWIEVVGNGVAATEAVRAS